MLRVWTRRLGSRVPTTHQTINITRGSGEGHGLAFAPSSTILGRVKTMLDAAEEMKRSASVRREAQRTLFESPDEYQARLASATSQLESAKVQFDIAWDWYAPRYIAEMRVSFGAPTSGPSFDAMPEHERKLIEEAMARDVRPHPLSWRWLLVDHQGHGVVLECYCPDVNRCHRGLLASVILPKLHGRTLWGRRVAVQYMGELT